MIKALSAIALLSCAPTLSTAATAANAASGPFSSDSSTTVYFGNGCFFHQQHTLVTLFEKIKLNRAGSSVTSISGYAGGKPPPTENELCYHNELSQSDYGELGHAEVVQVSLPDMTDSLRAAAEIYFSDFTELEPGQWTRRDVFDIGPEYRSIIGLPGGFDNLDAMSIISSANKHNLTLLPGTGGDPDTISSNTVYIMDTFKFPSFQAEICLQFHDDSPAYSPPYSKSYHDLQGVLMDAGTLHNTTCPANFIC